MNGNKDSAESIEFMTLFQKLRDLIDDDPEGLEGLALADESVKQLCDKLHNAGVDLSIEEGRHRSGFATPVDPKYIEAWRDFEERYAGILASIWLSKILLALEDVEPSSYPASDFEWQNADYAAEEQAGFIEAAIDFAAEQAMDESRVPSKGFPEDIEEGISAWDRLKAATGFDLRGVFRRRELVPFVLVPRHVARQHRSAERHSLLTQLQQVHDAFVFGVPLAAFALMRSVMEQVLRDYYGAEGKNLKERINNCGALPKGSRKAALHRLREQANAILHSNNKTDRLPQNKERKEAEMDIVWFLLVLRNLIERAPAWRAS